MIAIHPTTILRGLVKMKYTIGTIFFISHNKLLIKHKKYLISENTMLDRSNDNEVIIIPLKMFGKTIRSSMGTNREELFN